MSYLDAIILGIVQGLTEFLPVSSSGHLVLLQDWLGYDPESPEMLTFDVISHLGTLLAIPIVFRRTIARALASRAHAKRLIGQAAIATIATAAIAVPLKDQFEGMFGSPRLVGLALIGTAFLLFVTQRRARPREGWRQLNWVVSGAIGISQALAVAPGLSRSGLTICTGMAFGLRRRWAAEFSFLIAAPAIAGATILKLNDFLGATSGVAVGPLAVGGSVAFAVGLLALVVLLRMVQRSRLHWFSYYLWPLGLIVMWGAV